MRTNRDKRLSNAVRLALGAGLAASLAMGPTAFAAEEEDSAELERVQVTGSRISRLDLEGALPVTVIDREDIDLSGHISVADLLRGTTFNSAGSFRPQSGSSAQSFAGLSLRGLGSSRTLILIDGRRAPVAPNVGSAQDLNAIPLAAVERIEILTDGASAIYGSDAIGGVVNIITRKDFTGAEITVGASDPSREGGETREFSAMLGVAGDRGQIMMGVNRDYRGIIFARDREWSAGGFSSFSNNFNQSSAFFDYYTNPTHGTAVPGRGCTEGAFQVFGTGVNSFCAYEFSQVSADEAELENNSLFVRGTYDINSDWTHYFNSSVSRVQSFGRYAPVPSVPWPGGLPALPAGTPNHPATSPANGGLNPLWADYQDVAGQDMWFQHRFAALGTRDGIVDSNVYDFNMGIEGYIGDFEVDFGVRSTESKYYDWGLNYVVGGLAQDFITSGDYNIYDPFSVSDDVRNSMISTITRRSEYYTKEVYAIASRDLFQLPAGFVSLAFGGEYREEDYEDLYDSLSEGGQIVGSAGNSAGIGRNVKAFFFESLIPLLDDLEMNIAGRYDGYSDYGNDFSPKISFKWTPMDEVTVRASYGQGFRAPTLDIISQKPSFSADSVVHDPTAIAAGLPAGTAVQITTYNIANPNLESEQSDQYALGVAFEPTNWFSGSVDYYNIEITNRVASIGSQQIVNCLTGTTSNCPPGLNLLDPTATPPENVNDGLGMAFAGNDPQNGAIRYGYTGFTNLGTITTSGLDINLTAMFNLGAGQLAHNLQLSQVMSYEVDSGADVAGDYGLPEMRATLQNQYNWGDFGVAWNLNYIGPQDEDSTGDPSGVDSWLTHDLQFNYFTPWNGRVSVGAMNVTDEDPPLDNGELRGFNFSLFNGYGRVPYLRYTQTF